MAKEEIQGLDIGAYLAAKKKGTARIIKVDGIPHFAQKKYHEDDARPISVLIRLDLAQAKAQRANTAALLTAMDEVIDDIEDAKEV